MLKLLKLIEKSFPKFYERCKNSEFINNLLEYYLLFLSIVKKEKKLVPFFLKSTFSYYILKNKSDVTFEFRGNKITMPHHLKGLGGFIEVWSDHFYDKIKGYNHVLDLGGYIGDSPLKFAQNNKKVTVYEAHPENFKYLLKNIENIKNITAYNQAVVGDRTENFIEIYGGSFNEGTGNGYCSTMGECIKVPTKSILDILQDDSFDALKMDIEGSEYDCFNSIMTSKKNSFLFKEGFVEFHLSKYKEKDLMNIENIIHWLKSNDYEIEYYDVSMKKYDSLADIKVNVILVYFKKRRI